MKKVYKIILLAWIVFGLSVSGYYYIYPPSESIRDYNTRQFRFPKYKTIVHKEPMQISALATIVGSILIFGIGLIDKPKS